MKKEISRRSLLDLGLRSIAGVGVLGSMSGSTLLARAGRELLTDAPSRRRALVCIYCFGGGDDHVLAASGRLHGALAELQPLHDRGALAVVPSVFRPDRMRSTSGAPGEVMERTYSALRFLPEGFATLEWAARAAHVEPITGSGAYRFGTGVSMVTPGGPRLDPSFENEAIRRLTRTLTPLRTSFPTSTLGRQLADACDLLRVGPALGMRNLVLFVGTTGMSRAATDAGLSATRHRELARAMAAFYAATVELGIASNVTTYTDGDFSDRSAQEGTRLVLGGSVRQSASQISALSQDTYAGAMASWFGLDHTNIRARFPEFEPAAAGVLA